jgi:hypothetical protein
MRTRTLIATLAFGALLATPAIAAAQGSGNRDGNRDSTEAKQRAQVERVQRDLDRDRMRSQDRTGVQQHDRDRIQDRTKAPEDALQAEERIYGNQLMSEQERLQYREQLMNAESEQAREQLKAQHKEKMQVRARNRNIKLDEAGDPDPED